MNCVMFLVGPGRWVYADGSEFEGQFEAGVRTEGKWKSADGRETYDGRYDVRGHQLWECRGVWG